MPCPFLSHTGDAEYAEKIAEKYEKQYAQYAENMPKNAKKFKTKCKEKFLICT